LDPYTLDKDTPLLSRFSGRYRSYQTTKALEKKFLDFKPFYIDTQFREIYHDLYLAYKRRDLVILQRSLSDPMYEVMKRMPYSYP
jgi:hypothetical protein